MLSIKTDLENVNWFIYIIEEFKKINLCEFDIEVISLDTEQKYKNIIYYTNKSNDGICIYNSLEKRPNKNIEYLKNDLFILNGTKSTNFSINYDLFWNAFVFLSRYEEYLSEQNGNYIYSYMSKHPREDKQSFLIPIVNILFNQFEAFLKKNFKNLIFTKKQKTTIELSHDVDYINKTIQLRLKQTAFNSYNTLKSITKPKKFIRNINKTIKFLFSNPSYWCFDYWQELENRYNKKSIFYIYVKNETKDLKSWLIDPSYDIKTDIRLQKKLKELHINGFEIGLHGSYKSANDFEKLKEEKEILEQILGVNITKIRQHWLNYFEEITPYSHNKLFRYDSTLGWNDCIGFRSGCANKYTPYDFKNQKAFEYEVIPQVIMDSNIFDYTNNDDIFLKAKKMLDVSKKVSKNTTISISWHQRVCNSDYNWHKFYKKLLEQ